MNKRRAYLLLFALVLLLGGWVYAQYRDSKQSLWIEARVKKAIGNDVYEQQMVGERELMKFQGSLPFYTPNFNHSDQQFAVFQKLVVDLNADSTIPPVKLDQFGMSQMLSIDILVQVRYRNPLGNRKLNIHTTAKLKAFKHETGEDAYN